MKSKIPINISIIIPHYNTKRKIFESCLESIQKQNYDLSKIEVIVVDDCSDENITPINEIRYKSKNIYNFKINWIMLKENKGPGYARREGLNASKGKYIMFMDSDDELWDKESLNNLYNEAIKDENLDIIIGKANEQLEDKTFFTREFNFIWVFAKLFKRSFLEKNNINFNDTRANEDNGFTTLCRMLTDNYKFVDKIVYYWCYTEGSITRVNNHEYYFTSIEGYVDNMIWVFNECCKREVECKDKVINHFTSVWIRMYFYLIEVITERPINQVNDLINWAKKYYRNVWNFYEDIVNEKTINSQYLYMIQQSNLFKEHIPFVSYPEFYNLISGKNKYLTLKSIIN